ncbi:MAG: hypothetical protein ACRC2H_02990 [Silanimonas sp.]
MATVPITDETTQQLELLAIFHYILAGITALFALFPILHLAIGLWMVSGGFPEEASKPGQPPMDPKMFGWLFVGIASALIALGMTLAALLAIAGRRLKQRRSHTFCLVVAGVSCMNMPLGTVLGVFTLVVLTRPGVREAFERA